MVKRTDFRPNNNSSSKISNKNRALIKEEKQASKMYANMSKDEERHAKELETINNKHRALTSAEYVDSIGHRYNNVNHFIEANEQQYYAKGKSEYDKLSKKEKISYLENRRQNFNHEDALRHAKILNDKNNSLNELRKRDVFDKSQITKQEKDLLMRRINSGKLKPNEVPHIADGEGYDLSEEQTKKGLDYLNNQDRTSRGVERKNTPFGYREKNILEHATSIRLKDVYLEHGNYYYPVYEVNSSDGSFDYYMSGGTIHIIG